MLGIILVVLVAIYLVYVVVESVAYHSSRLTKGERRVALALLGFIPAWVGFLLLMGLVF